MRDSPAPSVSGKGGYQSLEPQELELESKLDRPVSNELLVSQPENPESNEQPVSQLDIPESNTGVLSQGLPESQGLVSWSVLCRSTPYGLPAVSIAPHIGKPDAGLITISVLQLVSGPLNRESNQSNSFIELLMCAARSQRFNTMV